MASEEILVFTTIGDRDMAEEHISEMLEQGIIVSGTIFTEVELVYLGKGKSRLIPKTKSSSKQRPTNTKPSKPIS